MAELESVDVNALAKELKEIISFGNANDDVYEQIIRLLGLPEAQFELLAPGVLTAYQQSLNNPKDKLALAQALNASGLKADDVVSSFPSLIEEVDKLTLPVAKRDFLKSLFATIVDTVNGIEGIAKRILQVPIEYCNPDAKMPAYAHDTDSGMDVFALEDITIHPGETALVPTGIKVALPLGFELQVRPKSGRALKTKLRVANTPGTIDQGYRDEIKVIIENIDAPIKDITIDEEGKVTSILYGSDFTIGKGEKFAQLVLAEVPKVAWYEVDSVNGIGEDRQGGFGSTGLK